MKIRLPFLCASIILVAFSSKAQITITQSDMFSVGKVFITANDTILTGVSAGSSGTGKFWNFSNLQNSGTDTTACVSPVSLSGFGNFPTANLAFSSGGQNNTFLNLNSSSLTYLGAYFDVGPPTGIITIKYNPAIKEISFPSNYLTTFTANSTSEIKYAVTYTGIDSIKSNSSDNYTSTMDGWGTITTPAFSNVACLRQFVNSVSTTTTYFHMTGGGWVQQGAPTMDTSFSYTWWSNIKKYPIADMNVNPSNGQVTRASYLLLQTATGIDEQAVTNNITFFPNPASDLITISGVSEISTLNIFDVTGKLIESRLLKNSSSPISVSEYENGIYFYEIIDRDKNLIDKGKFVVAK